MGERQFDDSVAQELEHQLLFAIRRVLSADPSKEALLGVLNGVLPDVVAKVLRQYIPELDAQTVQYVCDNFVQNVEVELVRLAEESESRDA